ncbi:MAG: hypothetical protein R3Y35_09260 [Clostridia bacterium]
MTKQWNNLLNDMMDCNISNFKQTQEFAYQKEREEHIDEMLTTNLTKDEKQLVDEVLLELGIAQEIQSAMLYKQGFKDCVLVLKKLRVI